MIRASSSRPSNAPERYRYETAELASLMWSWLWAGMTREAGGDGLRQKVRDGDLQYLTDAVEGNDGWGDHPPLHLGKEAGRKLTPGGELVERKALLAPKGTDPRPNPLKDHIRNAV